MHERSDEMSIFCLVFLCVPFLFLVVLPTTSINGPHIWGRNEKSAQSPGKMRHVYLDRQGCTLCTAVVL